MAPLGVITLLLKKVAGDGGIAGVWAGVWGGGGEDQVQEDQEGEQGPPHQAHH